MHRHTHTSARCLLAVHYLHVDQRNELMSFGKEAAERRSEHSSVSHAHVSVNVSERRRRDLLQRDALLRLVVPPKTIFHRDTLLENTNETDSGSAARTATGRRDAKRNEYARRTRTQERTAENLTRPSARTLVSRGCSFPCHSSDLRSPNLNLPARRSQNSTAVHRFRGPRPSVPRRAAKGPRRCEGLFSERTGRALDLATGDGRQHGPLPSEAEGSNHKA